MVKDENCGISIVIITLNSGGTLRLVLKSIINTLSSHNAIPYEIIIVDAGSQDETLEIAKDFGCRIIKVNGVSRGKARNIGATHARYPILIFLDSDCMITDEWVEATSKILVNICKETARQREVFTGPSRFTIPVSLLDLVMKKILTDSVLTLSSKTFMDKCRSMYLKEAPAMNLIVPKGIFVKVQGFPDRNYNEDTIFSQRIIRNGYRIRCVDELKVIHVKSFRKISDIVKFGFSYGKGYGETLLQMKLLRRYALLCILSPIVISLIATINVLLLFLISGLFFVILLLYGILRTQDLKAGFTYVVSSITLFFSYIIGFYVGFFNSLLNYGEI